ncbi:MAG: sirohydrochlorin chelatase [Planctomycetota bacterium]|jgi:sirohydrochlorin cobaltochelatase
MFEPDTAILVVGHGTRKAAGADQLRQLVESMRQQAPGAPLFESFLELAEPSIEEALERVAASGLRRVKVVPVLLFAAGHAKSDIPDAVAAAASKLGIEVLGQSPPLGTGRCVLELSETRYEEIGLRGFSAGCPEGHCARAGACQAACELPVTYLGTIGLAMVGRGASDPEALTQMRTLTQMACARRHHVAWYETGFFTGGSPNVDELFDLAAASGCDTIIVQPHLLFEGELMDQLRARFRDRMARHAPQRWLLTRALGGDPGLARVFLEMAGSV